MTQQQAATNQTFIKKIESLPDGRAIVALLLLAEEANKNLVPECQKTAEGTRLYINLCWDWLGHQAEPLAAIKEDACQKNNNLYDIMSELSNLNGRQLDAFRVCNAVIDYVTYKTYQNAEPENNQDMSNTDGSMLEYVFREVPLQNYLTPEILSFTGFQPCQQSA